MSKVKRRKHLLKKEDRDPKTGYCLTSLWGPFCFICRDKQHADLSKALKGVDFSKIKISEETKKKIKERTEARLKKSGFIMNSRRRPILY